MGVVKLYLTEATSKHKAWVERATGVASLTKDYARKSYFIQIFDMQHYKQVSFSSFHVWQLVDSLYLHILHIL